MLRWSGLPYSRSSRFQSSSCPSRSSFPSLQPRPSAPFLLRRGFKPLGFFKTTSPEARGGCGAFRARLSETIPDARTPRRPDPGSYLEAALGRLARQAGALPTGAPGPRAPAGCPAARGRSRGREGAATRPGGWRRRRGGERRREGGGRAGAGERASEDSSARDSPRSLPSSSALRSFFPNSRPRPPHLWPPLTLAGSAGPEAEPGRASGEGAGGGNRYLCGTLLPPSLLPGPCTAGARGLGRVFPRFWGPPHRVENCPRAVSVWRAPRTLTLRECRRGRVLRVIPSHPRAPFASTALHPPAPVGQRCPRTERKEGNRIERQG